MGTSEYYYYIVVVRSTGENRAGLTSSPSQKRTKNGQLLVKPNAKRTTFFLITLFPVSMTKSRVSNLDDSAYKSNYIRTSSCLTLKPISR